MLAAVTPSLEAYAAAMPALVAALPPTLHAPPLQLLGVTATWYLRPYLGAAEHRDAMRAALQRARAEASGWATPPDAHAEPEVQLALTKPADLYLQLWRRALAGGTAWHLVLAQHACEIGELLERPLPGLDRLLSTTTTPRPDVPDGATAPSSGDALELLSRALLGYRIDLTTFVELLLALHAANRAVELTGGWTGAQLLAAQLVASLPLYDRPPKRLRAVQPHELARRAVVSGSALAALAVEAGLTEAEQLTNGRRLWLLAALDRAVIADESHHDRY